MANHIIMDKSATRSKDIKKALRFLISSSELLLYLCDKYNLPLSIRNIHETNWCDCSLRLAFYSRNEELADEVRKKKKTFTWSEWLRYYGAHNSAIYYGYRVAASLPNLFRKENNLWQ